MVYFIKSPYMSKLYNRLKEKHSKITLIDMDAVDKVQLGDKVVLDASDYPAFKAMNFVHEAIIVLGSLKDAERHEKTISKFQSYKQIESMILDATFPVYFLTQTNQSILTDDQLSDISNKLDIDYRVSLNYSPNSGFSLYDHFVEESNHHERHKTINVITCIKDHLDPPISLLLGMVEKMRTKGSVLIYSAPLKGPLDYAFITTSDSILLLGEGNATYGHHDLSSILPPEKLIVINHMSEFGRLAHKKDDV